MRATQWLAASLALCLCSALAGTAPWHRGLSYPGDGYWRCRVPVTVRNGTEADAKGRTVELRVGQAAGELALVGQSVASLRVCDERGSELLYDLLGKAGEPKREGTLAEGDRLAFGAECPRGGSATCYVYADNPQAWVVADWLGAAAPFENGGFELGQAAPLRWKPVETSDQHRVSWVDDAPHSGKRCGRCDVDAAAPPSWVKWVQDDIRVAPDADYRLEAWVKAKDTKGQAGWFIHVHGAQPMVVNQVANAGEGSYDWKRVEIAFHTPPDALRASIGTVLHGTGTAWYDDASLALLTKEAPLSATAATPERRSLSVPLPLGGWRDPSASHRVGLKVRNWSGAPVRTLAYADLGALTRRLPPGVREGEIRVMAPGTGEPAQSLTLERRLLFVAEVPAMTEGLYHAYSRRVSDPYLGSRGPVIRYSDLVASKANLVANPGFEEPAADGASPPRDARELESLPIRWALSAESDEAAAKLYRAARDSEAKSGKGCARLEIPPGAPLKWSGWHQGEVPVKPLTAYLYAAYLRCKDVNDGSVQLHGHFHNAAGKLCEAAKYFGAGPALAGTQDWTLLVGLIQTPADCASVALHLTMNAHGTVWHDDVFFGEATEALIGPAEAHRPLTDPEAKRCGYAAWLVNPIVKVFPDDPPGESPSRIDVAAARNECEPFQLALRPTRDLRNVAIAIDPPRTREGQVLSDITLHLVGFVPVDHPSSYYTVDVPAWYRKLPPRGQTGCDGWPGLWPDPLPPYKPFDLKANTTQPIWATLRIPPDAEPGTYRGTVTIKPENAPATEIPLQVTVWDFALPKTSHVRAIYDFREHGIREFGGASGAPIAGNGHPLPGTGAHEELLRKWWKFLADHRISPGILPAPKFDYKDGKVTMDTAEFDRAAAYCLDELGMNVFYSPWFFYAFGWAHPPSKLFGFEPFTKEYADAYTKCLKAYMDHLRKKGWADKVVLYVSDEPHFRRKGVVEQMIKLCQMIRSIEPQMRIYSSTWEYCPEWAGHINVWGVGPHGSFPVETLRERQRAGDTLWFTTDGHMCLDTPSCAIERLLPWLCWKYGVQAYEFWGVNWWTYDPWERGWHTFISQSDDGVKYYYVRYPNGDGYLAYPGKRVGVDGPVSSIRLEQVREGIEDYEYLHLLDQLIAEANEKGVNARGAERVRAEAAALVAIPNQGGRYSTSLLPAPSAVPQFRAAVADAIERLARRLR